MNEKTECENCGLPTQVDDYGLCNSCHEKKESPKHTAGPWHPEPEEASEGRGIAICGNDDILATITPMDRGVDQQDRANAKLICAAPTLLHALTELLATIELHTDCMSGEIRLDVLEPYIEQAEAAIAAAAGDDDYAERNCAHDWAINEESDRSYCLNCGQDGDA